MLTVIPFSGFYCSAHDSDVDYALDQYFQDDHGDPISGLIERAWDHINWTAARTLYAKAYAENFAIALKIRATFESMTSPREYNFTTDRIFMTISQREVYRIRRETPPGLLAEVAAEMFTSRSSRSGFSSYYEPDVKTWGALKTWDYSQLLALMTAYARHELGDDWSERDLMEYEHCNGGMEEMLAEAGDDEFRRLDKVYAYLRDRQERNRPALNR